MSPLERILSVARFATMRVEPGEAVSTLPQLRTSDPHRCTVLLMLVLCAGAPDTCRTEGVGREHSTGHPGRHAVLRRQAVPGKSPRGCAHLPCVPDADTHAAHAQHTTRSISQRWHVSVQFAHHAWTAHADVSQAVTSWARTGTYAPPQAGLSGPQAARLIAEENTRRLLRLGNEMLRCVHHTDEQHEAGVALGQ